MTVTAPAPAALALLVLAALLGGTVATLLAQHHRARARRHPDSAPGVDVARRIVDRVVADCAYRDWTLTTRWLGTYEFQIILTREEADSRLYHLYRSKARWPFTSTTTGYLGTITSAEAIENSTLDAVWAAIRFAEEHERGEFFTYQGRRPFLPPHTPNGTTGGFDTQPPQRLTPDEWQPAATNAT